MNTILEFKNLSFSYGKTKIIDDFSLSVEEKSFATLLGPSGCGKTTLLRLASGFMEPDSGDILVNGKSQKGIAPNKRNIAYVFQDYALFPHMTVEKNILYGLKLHSNEKELMTYKLEQKLRLLGLVGLENAPWSLPGSCASTVRAARPWQG